MDAQYQRLMADKRREYEAKAEALREQENALAGMGKMPAETPGHEMAGESDALRAREMKAGRELEDEEIPAPHAPAKTFSDRQRTVLLRKKTARKRDGKALRA